MPKPIVISFQGDEPAAAAFTEFSKGRNVDSEKAFQKGALSKLIQEDNGPIFFMGHTDDTRKTLGELTPKELAKKFATGIKEEDRAKVKDLYLISCEAGLIPPNLAKQLSEELRQHGFTNLNVHAISSTPVQNARAMYVQVITRQGAFSRAATGSVQAYAYTNDEHGQKRKQLDDQMAKLAEVPKAQRDKVHHSQLAAASKQLTAMRKAGTQGIKSLMKEQETFEQLMAEFNKPQNTYKPQQVSQRPQPAPHEQPGLLARMASAVGIAPPPSKTYKINIAKAKFIEAYDEMINKLSKLKAKYKEDSKAYKAAKELVDALEPIYNQAKEKLEVNAPVALVHMELERVERAVEEAQKELPQHRGWFAWIKEFLGIKTESGKKLSAITEVVSEEIETSKTTGPTR